MSFWPLAKNLTEALRAARARAPMVELGCGAGELLRRLRHVGVECIGLDRSLNPLRESATAGDVPRLLCADAAALPLRDECLAAVVCANLLRHCRSSWPQIERACQRVLRDDGILVVLEDDVADSSAAAANYHETLRLLARADPSRGESMAAGEARDLCKAQWGIPVIEGRTHNELEVAEPQLPLRWLRSRRLGEDDRRCLRSLARRVDRHGMAYGRFFYQVYGKDKACAV